MSVLVMPRPAPQFPPRVNPPRTYFSSNYTPPTNLYYDGTQPTRWTTMTPLVLTEVIPGDEQVTIRFIDPSSNSYNGFFSQVVVFVNDRQWAYINPTVISTVPIPGTNNVGVLKQAIIGGFTNDLSYRIQVATMKWSFPTSTTINYFESPLSNTFTFQTSWTFTESVDTSVSFNTVGIPAIDIIKQPYSIYNTSSLVATSTYTNFPVSNNQFNPYGFESDLLIGIYDAKVKLKARFMPGANDYTFFGDVDYVFKDIDITFEKTFTNPRNSFGDNISNIYDEGTALFPNPIPPILDSSISDAVNSILKRECYANKLFIEKSIKQKIKSNYSLTLASRSVARMLYSIISFKEPTLTASWKEYILPYKGRIWIKAKFLLASAYNAAQPDSNKFNYEVRDANGKAIHSGRNSGVILLSDPKDGGTFDFGVFRSINDVRDLYGTR